MSEIHQSCTDIWDKDITGHDGPICKNCLEQLGEIDYYSGAGDW